MRVLDVGAQWGGNVCVCVCVGGVGVGAVRGGAPAGGATWHARTPRPRRWHMARVRVGRATGLQPALHSKPSTPLITNYITNLASGAFALAQRADGSAGLQGRVKGGAQQGAAHQPIRPASKTREPHRLCWQQLPGGQPAAVVVCRRGHAAPTGRCHPGGRGGRGHEPGARRQPLRAQPEPQTQVTRQQPRRVCRQQSTHRVSLG